MSSDIKVIFKLDRESFIQDFNKYLDLHKEGYFLVVSPKDEYMGEPISESSAMDLGYRLRECLEQNPDAVCATTKKLFQFPNRMAGVLIRLSAVEDASKLEPQIASKISRRLRLKNILLFDYEADFLLRLIDGRAYLVQQEIGGEYVQGDPGDGNLRENLGAYDKGWYFDNIRDFLLPYFEERSDDMLSDNTQEGVSFLAQHYAMYCLQCRLEANQNNRNKHVLDTSDIEKYKQEISKVLQYIDDDIIMNIEQYPENKRDFQMSRMFLRLKYNSEGTDLNDDKILDKYLKSDYVLSKLKCNIQFMNIKDDNLEIDGSLPDIYSTDKARYYFDINGTKIYPKFCERYGLTKYFGESAYKRLPFHASVPVGALMGKQIVHFVMTFGGTDHLIPLEFKSHTSRLAAYPRNSYWHSGRHLFTIEEDWTENGRIVTGIIRSDYNWLKMAAKEIGVGCELLFSFQMHRFRFFLLRAAWVVTHPYFGQKNIWMFFDKIYKGGDSAEYLYKYATKRITEDGGGDEFSKSKPDKLYYLLDEKASDYKRLKEEGYTPLKRGSFLHRLVFLNADMMIVTNSTVFAFNDYYLENSRYIRGIPDFHTVCVQHGLSVQKIALAQQRLRDNTRLYFCASQVEIGNLLHPVYDYEGYDALRLTGLPRYDGLINNDKKQIMISPTWRMQSAMLVTQNEGVERDYNPNFKETEYYKVYNSLINDARLIDAAEKYGYRIAYVLHPIVSPQAKDFDINEYVDIIPSVGDMSYEKMLCESSLMVTDYSGIQFDFAYMRKPIVYYHPEELEAHYDEGSFHYDTMAFGEITRRKDELVTLLIQYMQEECKMKELYQMRADNFFAFDDHSNSKRVYEEIVRYQNQLMSR